MWYHLLMRKVGDHYEAVLSGKTPDAFMVEVGDIAMGFRDTFPVPRGN